jgi:hypothetical protein
MKSFNTLNKLFVRLAFSLTAIFVLSSASSAQIKLRNALDYNGDGKADYNIFRNTDSTWYIKKSDGSGSTGTAFGVSNTDTIAPGDYDGDGKGDLCVWRYSNGVFYFLGSQTNTYQARQFGTIGDEIVSRDYDGDNKTDFAVVRRTAGTNGTMTWYIYNTGSGTFSGLQFGLSSDNAVPGDYDGDGKFDIAVQRPNGTSAAITYVLGSTTGFYAVQFGLGTDLIVPGDYDGDGKTDVTAVRKTGGGLIWYILNSSNNQVQAKTLGTAEIDTPVQNDYDRDGKTDVAVWRETDVTFNVLQSSNSTTVTTQWGYTSDTPIAGYDTH